MGNKAVSKQARRAAREAAAAAAEEVVRRTKANVEDLASFFDARDRAEAVDVWLAERQQALAEQAAQRRAIQRAQCGTALRSMRDRGETLREIARMAGISEKAVRELIREVESPESVAESVESPRRASVGAAEGATLTNVGGAGAPADGHAWEPVSARA
ncbi:hypothetical protein [Mycobacterium intracellulare]|uniref:hypothetical protein n=1 Tax=Mycobacterium intracellulare TaxID=1767 RepID=UPI0006CAA62D|nr:hypothetical protein [Mycobacterium intracellulare]MDM3908880.1 hypothetical protein [Mycobacterium intracellulare subsp. chimaera]